MNLPDKLNEFFKAPRLTNARMFLALAVAVVTDGLQLLFGAVPVLDQVIDVIAMVIITWLIGFHVLLLPTFAVKLIPLVDELPTWTACTVAVIAFRKQAQSTTPPPPPPIKPPPEKPVIDI